ncbi:MAG: DUF4430 domain-containing protein [Anaerovoracaceae bacterium]
MLKNKNMKKWLSMLLMIAIMMTMIPSAAFAQSGSAPAEDAVVTLTVSNKGALATANDGSLMAEKEVTVKDINSDGKLTFGEALAAAHAEYNSEEGYAERYGTVSKLWGIETGNTLFFINGVGLTSSVSSDTVKGGDRLTASINSDDIYYADWYSAFDTTSKNVKVGEEFSLTLKGYLGMAYEPEDMKSTALAGVSVGTASASGFFPIDGKTTDESGKVTLSFDKAGTYYITASGTVEDVVTDWNLMNMTTDEDNPVYGTMDWNTYDTLMAYTEEDYGDGPYPADEIKYVDFLIWVEDQDSYNTLRSNQLIADCPIIAPVCVVTVAEESDDAIDVSVSILGDESHNSDADGKAHTLTDGNLLTWVDGAEYTVSAGSTVADALELAFEDNDMTVSNPDGNYIDSVTYKGVKLGTGTNGPNSCWMYTLNEDYPALGIAEQKLSDGDEIVLHYTDDYAREAAFAEPEQTAADVIALIDAIGDVTRDSGEAIEAARAAYDSLSAEEQAKVTNYNALMKAEQEYALLRSDIAAIEEVYKETGDRLSALGVPEVGSVGGEWLVIGLARSGREVADEYYDNVVKFIRENINDKEQLDQNKSTENSRVILALTALGLDVTDVDGHNLLVGLTDMSFVTRQGVNGPIMALIALDSNDYDIPEVAESTGQVTRERLIDYILRTRLSDGGWALTGTTSDADMTAMALIALAPYYDGNSEVKAAVDEALECLSDMQLSTGGYMSGSVATAESCAQVIEALTALGIDPATDSRFIKNGTSVLDALLSFAVDGGGFRHTQDGDYDQMATEQGYCALTAYARFLGGQTALYDMSDVKDDPIYSQDPADDNRDDPAGQETAEDTGASSETVKTGDQNDLAMLWVICGLGAAGTVFAAYSRKKEN